MERNRMSLQRPRRSWIWRAPLLQSHLCTRCMTSQSSPRRCLHPSRSGEPSSHRTPLMIPMPISQCCYTSSRLLHSTRGLFTFYCWRESRDNRRIFFVCFIDWSPTTLSLRVRCSVAELCDSHVRCGWITVWFTSFGWAFSRAHWYMGLRTSDTNGQGRAYRISQRMYHDDKPPACSLCRSSKAVDIDWYQTPGKRGVKEVRRWQ
jgi:hypothetical protein